MRMDELQSKTAHAKESPINSFYLSLSDLMTLLCVFFAVLVGMSRIDVGQFERVRTAVSGQTAGTLVELAKDLQAISAHQPGVSVRLAADGVRLDFESAALFDSGSSYLRDGSLKPMEAMLRRILGTTYTVDVEGHTDDVPLYHKDGQEVETNWTLSGRRAGSVVNYLAQFGFSEARLRIVGYSSTRPRISIKDKFGPALEKARSENRRVSLLIR